MTRLTRVGGMPVPEGPAADDQPLRLLFRIRAKAAQHFAGALQTVGLFEPQALRFHDAGLPLRCGCHHAEDGHQVGNGGGGESDAAELAAGYEDCPFAYFHIRTKALKIICDKPTAINLDGELRTAETVHIEVAKEKVRFFYPKELSFSLSVTA